MAKIFISYDRASKVVVEQLVQDLMDDDHEIWFDQGLTVGQNWWDNILSQIRQCEIFVAALTPAFLESKPCQRELKYATDLQRNLLPVRLSDKVLPASLPPHWSELQWVDYSRPDKTALQTLQRTLRSLSKAPPLPDPLPHPPPVPISPLSHLRVKIETDSQLQFQDQIQLVFELTQQFRSGVPAKELMDLLQRLKRREDLLAVVVKDIDQLQTEISRSRPELATIEKATATESNAKTISGEATGVSESMGDNEVIRKHSTAPFYSDHPARWDALNRKAVAESIATMVENVWKEDAKEENIDRTFMVHLHGRWGSGKTSILNFLKVALLSHSASKSSNKGSPRNKSVVGNCRL